MDEAEEADLRALSLMEGQLSDVRHKLSKMVPGEPGECEKCGETMPRLVNNICCRCRDKYNLG